MNFVLSLTFREIRSSWRRLLFFFLSIAIGVGSIVAIRSIIGNLNIAVAANARNSLTADVEISTTNDFTPAEIAAIEDAAARSGNIEKRGEAITSNSMARPSDPNNQTIRPIELKGIDDTFPLVGEFYLSDGSRFDFRLLQNNGAVVAKIFLETLNVKIGDKIKIGDGEFQIRATFENEPGAAGGFQLGSRVFVEASAFETTGIAQNRSRVRRRILLRTNENPSEFVKALREELKGKSITVRSYREMQENMDEQFRRMEDFLSLTGLLVLVLGGVGVWNVARVFIEQKRKSIAVLKCLGAGSSQIVAANILQIAILALLGSGFGVVLSQLALWTIQWKFAAALPETLSYSIRTTAALQGILLGIAVAFIFAILPLLNVQNIKPILLLRDEANTALKKLDRVKWIAGAVSLTALLGLFIWQAGSLIVGSVFAVTLLVTTFVLSGAASLLLKFVAKLNIFGSFAFRQALNSLHRPGNQTRVVLLAVGLGAFVVIGVQVVGAILLKEFDFSQNSSFPSLFAIDGQRSQVDEIKKIFAKYTSEEPETIPTVRARLAFKNGEPFSTNAPNKDRRQDGQIGREFAIPYRAQPEPNETVVAGNWFVQDDFPEVSIDEDFAEDLEIAIGDSITFEVSGRLVTAYVSNFRHIDRKRARTAFLFVMEPGILDYAPQTFTFTILKKLPTTDRLRLQRDLVDAFPNLQIFDVADITESLLKMLENFVSAISFIGGFVVLSGLLILIGSVALTKSARIYENAILKTLGAERRTLSSILLLEYVVLGALSGLIGSFFAVIMSYFVTKYLFEIDWRFEYSTALRGAIATTLIVAITGLISSYDVILKKPLAILRRQ